MLEVTHYSYEISHMVSQQEMNTVCIARIEIWSFYHHLSGNCDDSVVFVILFGYTHIEV